MIKKFADEIKTSGGGADAFTHYLDSSRGRPDRSSDAWPRHRAEVIVVSIDALTFPYVADTIDYVLLVVRSDWKHELNS